ncbi:MAG TPA: hypothetical protein VK717_06515 [Opitutaceae bacterium]|nr:hypothetical protein [Opitutaceae bacterium]
MIEEDEIIDLRELILRLARGLGQIFGLALLGLVIAVVGGLIIRPWQPVSTSTRVVFSYPGFAKGEYPDHSKFQPDDLRAPEVIAEALKRQGLGTADEFQSQIRGALGIEGIISPAITKQRDLLQASGQSLAVYIPDEYIVTLSLPEKFPISREQRARLLSEIVSVYRENFQRTYTRTPAAFGNVFDALHNADFPEYQQILGREIDHIADYLTQQLENGKSFRSPTTNLSFEDLLEQTRGFSHNQLNERLELIYQSGLSRNRTSAMMKVEYSLRILGDQERHAMEDQKVFTDLLAQVQARNYVIETKSRANQLLPDASALSQDSDPSFANDTYGFLVRRALEAGLKVSQLQADKAQLLEQLEALKSAKGDAGNMAEVQKSFNELEPAYRELIDNIRKTQADFARQQFADAIRVSAAITTSNGISRMLALTGATGCFLGLAVGMGLSLFGIYIGSPKHN